MKKFLTILAALVLGAPAFAADLPVKSPLYSTPPLFNWSGIYVGIHGGYDFAAQPINLGTTTNVPANLQGVLGNLTDPGSIGSNATGGAVGGHIGLLYQTSAQWVIGTEFDFDVTGVGATAAPVALTPIIPLTTPAASFSLPWDAKWVLKAGYLVEPNLLMYVRGGAAAGEIKATAAAPTLTVPAVTTLTLTNSTTNVHYGWTAGAGLEYALTKVLLFGIEYNYVDLGHRGVTLQNPSTPTLTTFNPTTSARFNEVMGRVTLKLF